MKVEKTVVIWIITALFILLVGWYGTTILWGLNQDGDIPGIIRWALLAVVFHSDDDYHFETNAGNKG